MTCALELVEFAGESLAHLFVFAAHLRDATADDVESLHLLLLRLQLDILLVRELTSRVLVEVKVSLLRLVEGRCSAHIHLGRQGFLHGVPVVF